MRLSCKKILLLLFPLVLIFALIGATACNGAQNPNDAKPILTTPNIDIAENVISWTAVENAGNYEVYENNTRVETQSETSYTISQTAAGTYKYKIKALSADENYSSSKFSNEVIYIVQNKTQLAAPQLSLDKDTKTISWIAVENADGYEVFEDGELVSSQSETSYTITHTETGIYNYAVKATTTKKDYSESQFSDELSYIISEQLAAPHIELDVETKTISWTAVEHADYYAIYEDGYVLYQSFNKTSYEIEQTIVGIHEYYIRARSNNAAVYLNSNESNKVTYEILPTVLETPSGLSEERDEQGHVTLVWNEVEGAGGYNIYMNNRLIEKRWSINSYSIDIVESNTYEYKVKAVPARGDKQYLESDISDPIEIEIVDSRTQLAVPQNLRLEEREFYYQDESGNHIGKPVDLTCLVWDVVENAESYLVYENGERVYSTTDNSFAVSTLYQDPKTYKFQVKAVAHGMLYKSSNLSEVFDKFKIPGATIKFTVNLNVDSVPNFAQSVQVGLFPQDNNGLPSQSTPIGGTTRNLTATAPATIDYSNTGKYIAKIISLPEGYCATEIKLSASSTEGTIYIYNKSAQQFNVSANNTLTIKVQNEPQSGLFIPTQAGQYTISTNVSKEVLINVGARTAIDTGNGLMMFTFTADANEAVLISGNSPEIGSYKFTIEKGAKSPSLQIGTGYGDNANVIAGNVNSVTYSLNLAQDTEFTFFFSTMYLGPTRFATVTINGEKYEFDGGYEYKKNIFIRAGQNIKIKVDISGQMTDETMSNIYFSVYPLTED